ncbi:hypothetical protein [Streptomyces sp. NPDC095613]|uniref:hypothetical protein n=1 Tax=Streptomyces sp. NPDC095613 TaxID=3155540 RepID=UPI003326F81C
MTRRTVQQASRRRTIVNAASGFPERNRVVLYVNVPDGADPYPILKQLREHAEARDWIVPEGYEFCDIGPEGRSRCDRIGWFEVARLLRESKADGVVAPAETLIAASPGERDQLRLWLSSLQKFAAYLQRDGHDGDAMGAENERAGA